MINIFKLSAYCNFSSIVSVCACMCVYVRVLCVRMVRTWWGVFIVSNHSNIPGDGVAEIAGAGAGRVGMCRMLAMSRV